MVTSTPPPRLDPLTPLAHPQLVDEDPESLQRAATLERVLDVFESFAATRKDSTVEESRTFKRMVQFLLFVIDKPKGKNQRKILQKCVLRSLSLLTMCLVRDLAVTKSMLLDEFDGSADAVTGALGRVAFYNPDSYKAIWLRDNWSTYPNPPESVASNAAGSAAAPTLSRTPSPAPPPQQQNRQGGGYQKPGSSGFQKSGQGAKRPLGSQSQQRADDDDDDAEDEEESEASRMERLLAPKTPLVSVKQLLELQKYEELFNATCSTPNIIRDGVEEDLLKRISGNAKSDSHLIRLGLLFAYECPDRALIVASSFEKWRVDNCDADTRNEMVDLFLKSMRVVRECI